MTVIRTRPPVVTPHHYLSESSDPFPGTSGDGFTDIPIGSTLEYRDNGHKFQYDGSQWWPAGQTLDSAVALLVESIDRLESAIKSWEPEGL